ncbi:MAG TPA: hypothetical protein VES39_05570 [Rhodospirillales bacterium]|nr:hypothetical protein [Rhodospirillales bacterium]
MPETRSTQLFLGRQPILGREQQLLAYELLFRDGIIATVNRADVLDPAPAASIIASAIAELAATRLPAIHADFLGLCLANALSWANRAGRRSGPSPLLLPQCHE